MDDALKQLIASEEAKLKVLESEVVTRRERIKVLKAMSQSTGELDAILAKATSTSTPAQQFLPLPAEDSWPQPSAKVVPVPVVGDLGGANKRHRKGEVKQALLSVLTFSAKALADIQEAVKVAGYDLSYDRVRTQLWSFKNDGLVASPEKGCYSLTEKGAEFLATKKGESPAPTGLSGATSSEPDGN